MLSLFDVDGGHSRDAHGVSLSTAWSDAPKTCSGCAIGSKRRRGNNQDSTKRDGACGLAGHRLGNSSPVEIDDSTGLLRSGSQRGVVPPQNANHKYRYSVFLSAALRPPLPSYAARGPLDMLDAPD